MGRKLVASFGHDLETVCTVQCYQTKRYNLGLYVKEMIPTIMTLLVYIISNNLCKEAFFRFVPLCELMKQTKIKQKSSLQQTQMVIDYSYCPSVIMNCCQCCSKCCINSIPCQTCSNASNQEENDNTHHHKHFGPCHFSCNGLMLYCSSAAEMEGRVFHHCYPNYLLKLVLQTLFCFQSS